MTSGSRCGERGLRGAGDLLADDRAHRAAHEPEVHDADRDRPAVDRAGAPDRGVAQPRRDLGGRDPVRVRPSGRRTRAGRPTGGRASRSTNVPWSRSRSRRASRRQPEVVAARRADALDLVELLVEQHLLARRALRPEVRRVGVAAGPEGGKLDRHQSSLADRMRGATRVRHGRPGRRGPSGSPARPGRARRQATIRGAGQRDRGGRQRAADQQRARQLAALVGRVVRRPSGSKSSLAPVAGARNGIGDALAADRGRRIRRVGRGLGEPGREALLEAERRVDADEVAAAAGRTRRGASGSRAASAGPEVASPVARGEERLEVAIGQERLDLAGRRARPRSPTGAPRAPEVARDASGARDGSGPGPRPRSGRGRRRSPRWTSRRRSAGRSPGGGPPGSRPTARQAAAASSRVVAPRLDVERVGDERRGLDRAPAGGGAGRGAGWRRRCGRSGTARRGTWRLRRRPPGARAPRTGQVASAARNVRSVASSASWWSPSS